MSHGLDIIGGRGGEPGGAVLNKQRDAHDRADVGRPEYRQSAPGGCCFHGAVLRTEWPEAGAAVNDSDMINSPLNNTVYKNSIIEPELHGKGNRTRGNSGDAYLTEQANNFFLRQFQSGERVSSRCWHK